jgi:uncharacterized membrane protein YbhN (UPF0104 family)
MQGIRSFHERGRLIHFSLLTAAIWLADAVSVVLCAASLGLALSIPIALLLLAGLGLGSALPSTPGYVGIYQFVAVSILTPFAVSRSDAVALSLLIQAMAYAGILVWGLTGLLKYRRSESSSGYNG